MSYSRSFIYLSILLGGGEGREGEDKWLSLGAVFFPSYLRLMTTKLRCQFCIFCFPLHVHRPDTRHIFVDVGLGFHVEFTWTEALEFISVKEARLARY